MARSISVPFAIVLGLVAINLFIYTPVLHYGFLRLDDPQYVTENPYVNGGLTWPAVRWALASGYAANWHPVTWLSHMLDVEIYGMNAHGHHLTSLLLHIANTVLLFGVLYRATGSAWRSGLVAILFGAHPLHVESVAWVAERKDVLSTLFGLLTLWAYVSYVRRPGLGRYLMVALLFALSLMAKPMLVTLPFVLLLLDIWPLARFSIFRKPRGKTISRRSDEWRSLVVEKLPLLALAIASSIVTFVVQRAGGAVSTLDSLPLTLRAGNAVMSYVAYMGKAIWPIHLAAFYPYRPLSLWGLVGSTVLLGGVSAAVLREARRRPYLLVGWLWYLVTLVPVIGLVQVGGQSMADRYTYVPLVGLFVMLVWGVADLFDESPYRRLAIPSIAGLAIAACAVTARAQVRYWENGMTLWGHALSVTTDNYVAHTYVGNAFAGQGNVNEAIAHYKEALRIRPDSEAYNNLGRALAGQGKLEEAIALFSDALRVSPSNPDAHNNLGVALANQGRVDEAIRHYREALRLQPDHASAHSNLGLALARAGHMGEAIQELETALRIRPDFEDARSALGSAHSDLGNGLLRRGAFSDAISHYREAVRLAPDLPEAHNGLGAALAEHDEPDDAIKEFTEAVRLKPDAADFHYNLARVLERQGRVAAAAEQLETAVRLNPNHPGARSALEQLRARERR